MTKILRLLLACLVLSPVSAVAQEAIVLTKPITTPARASYAPVRMELTKLPQARIEVVIRSNDGVDERFVYPCKPGDCTTDTEPETAALLDALNTADLKTRNLWRRIMDRLVADFPSRFPGGATVQ